MPSEFQIAGLVLAACVCAARAGPYSPPAGVAGSEAIPATSPRFSAWAVAYTNYVAGSECDEQFQTPLRALGPAAGDVYDIVSLGRGGEITLHFTPPITDGPGEDFAVFENAVTGSFLELAYVEVSSDGHHFARFPSDSLTSGPIGPFFDPVDSTDVNGLAGTFALSYGTPFDLSDLAPSPMLDPHHVRWIRMVDIIGDGSHRDTDGSPIYDPYPTVQSAGFDLEAIGVIHQAVEPTLILQGEDGLGITFSTGLHRLYQLEFSVDLTPANPWRAVGPELAGTGSPLTVGHTDPSPPAGAYRIRIRMEDTR